MILLCEIVNLPFRTSLCQPACPTFHRTQELIRSQSVKPGSFSARTDAASRPCGDATTTTIALTTATRRPAVSGPPVFPRGLLLSFFLSVGSFKSKLMEPFSCCTTAPVWRFLMWDTAWQKEKKKKEKSTHVMHCHADTHSPPDHA